MSEDDLPAVFRSRRRWWHFTWTTYGTWLPGDKRGFVSNYCEDGARLKRNNRLEDEYTADLPELIEASRHLMHDSVRLREAQAVVCREQFLKTADHYRWQIAAGAIMPTHVHLLIGTPGDPEPEEMLRDLKSFASRTLNKYFERPDSGRWWTKSGSRRKVGDPDYFAAAYRYVLNQHDPLKAWADPLPTNP